MVLISLYKYIHYKIIYFKPDKNIYTEKIKKIKNKIWNIRIKRRDKVHLKKVIEESEYVKVI
mgnify:FL=1